MAHSCKVELTVSDWLPKGNTFINRFLVACRLMCKVRSQYGHSLAEFNAPRTTTMTSVTHFLHGQANSCVPSGYVKDVKYCCVKHHRELGRRQGDRVFESCREVGLDLDVVFSLLSTHSYGTVSKRALITIGRRLLEKHCLHMTEEELETLANASVCDFNRQQMKLAIIHPKESLGDSKCASMLPVVWYDSETFSEMVCAQFGSVRSFP